MTYQLEVVDFVHLPPDEAILSPREQAFYKTLRFPKRRSEWLGGRCALKRLVAAETGEAELSEIEVLPQTAGKPQLLINGASVPWAFSLTHSHGFAVAALSTQAHFLGIDLEKVEHRIEAWKTDFFHPSELTQEGDEFLTALWTQKEALVKLLGTGLTLNSFDVRCIKGQPRFYREALRLYKELGQPKITLQTSALLPGFQFSVAVESR